MATLLVAARWKKLVASAVIQLSLQVETLWSLSYSAVSSAAVVSRVCHVGWLVQDVLSVNASVVVHFYGTHSVDIDGELAQLDTDGYRPLRLADVAAATR